MFGTGRARTCHEGADESGRLALGHHSAVDCNGRHHEEDGQSQTLEELNSFFRVDGEDLTIESTP